MALEIVNPAGSTPITSEQLGGLRRGYRYISVQSELDAAEQQAIAEGFDWALRSRKLASLSYLLSDAGVRRIHQAMLGKIYRWAGTYRSKQVAHVGIDPAQITVLTRLLCDDARAWVESDMDPVEVAVRFRHRLVSIHPFANGNGRHARLMGDLILIKHYRREALPWGGGDLRSEGAPRGIYHHALHQADAGNLQALIAFATGSADSARSNQPHIQPP